MRRLASGMAVAALVAAPLVALPGCRGAAEPAENDPQVTMRTGEFTFAVQARDWTTDRGYVVNMATRAVKVALAVESFRGGSGRVDVFDYAGTVVWTRPLEGTAADVQTQRGGPGPFRVRVVTNGFSGFVAMRAIPFDASF